jgi:hypothetical protein
MDEVFISSLCICMIFIFLNLKYPMKKQEHKAQYRYTSFMHIKQKM